MFRQQTNRLVTTCILTKRYYKFDHLFEGAKERDRRSSKKVKELLLNKSKIEILNYPFIYILNHLKLLLKDLKHLFTTNIKLKLEQGDCELIYKFNKKEILDKWMTSNDSGYDIGKSTVNFTLTQQNTALFNGNLSTSLNKPENTQVQYSGYCNIHSITQYGPFNIKRNFNLSDWTHFLFKIKGDGRTYTIILNTPGFYTITYADFYTYPLYTRGGPYWQYAKIPFSKFVSATHGRVTDRQVRFNQCSISNIGITLMDNVNGPFSLEIDFIGVVKDNTGYEEFSYELYKAPKYVSNN